MHTLLVLSHPSSESLTHSVAKTIAKGLINAGKEHTVDFLDLYQEGFNPLFSEHDMSAYRQQMEPPHDVLDQQKRIEAAQSLVLVFPIHWWGMPAMLKGWVDRVFTNGWAFDWSPEMGARKRLQGLKIHIFCIGGAESSTYLRHGYDTSIKKNIGEGLFNYVGASVESFHVLGDSESTENSSVILKKAQELSQLILEAAKPRKHP